MPSLDLTQMRGDLGAGYSPTSPTFTRYNHLRSSWTETEDGQDQLNLPTRGWANIGGPDSQIASSGGTSELYHLSNASLIGRSQAMDEEEASHVVQSLNASAWSGAIRGTPHVSRPSTGGSDRSAGSDVRE
jgi:hypothetical protein